MKKIVFTLIIALMLVVLPEPAYGNSEIITINADCGTVSINYDTTDYSDLKVMVKKGSERYFYNLYSSDEELPLQMGSGEYIVGLYRKVADIKYKQIELTTFNLSLNDNTVFLASVQNIAWQSDCQAAILAKELTKDMQSDTEKVKIVYDYLLENIEYDHEKAKNICSRYLPKAAATLADGKGICYDYASLMAVMLRSVNIPTKLVHGHSQFTSDDHAWNEVFIDGQWIIVDTTIDVAYEAEDIEITFAKDAADYEVIKVF